MTVQDNAKKLDTINYLELVGTNFELRVWHRGPSGTDMHHHSLGMVDGDAVRLCSLLQSVQLP